MEEAATINWQDVVSSGIDAIGHDGTDMFVQYKGGRVYRFSGVSADRTRMVAASESVGKAVNALGIKGTPQ